MGVLNLGFPGQVMVGEALMEAIPCSFSDWHLPSASQMLRHWQCGNVEAKSDSLPLSWSLHPLGGDRNVEVTSGSDAGPLMVESRIPQGQRAGEGALGGLGAGQVRGRACGQGASQQLSVHRATARSLALGSLKALS